MLQLFRNTSKAAKFLQCKAATPATPALNSAWSSMVQKQPKTVDPYIEQEKRKAQEFLASMDEATLQKKQEIETQMEVMRAENKRVPDFISDLDWKMLLTEHSSYTKREKYLNYLFKKEKARLNARQKKEMERQAKTEQQVVEYESFPQHSVHIPQRDKDEKWWKGVRSLRSDISVVYDLDFDCSVRELTQSYQQMQFVFGDNVNHLQPLQIHCTSINRHERLKILLERSKSFAFGHEEHFLDIFPPDELVYLSPSGPPLKIFDPSCTYVVGAFVDINVRPRMTYGLARRYGIRCASFPIKNYCEMIGGTSTILTLNCVHNILADMYLHQSWKDAFSTHMPGSFFLRGDREGMKRRMQIEERREQKRFRQIMDP